MKLMRKIVTFRVWLNQLLRKPQRVSHTRLDTGMVVMIQVFKNKQIIKVL